MLRQRHVTASAQPRFEARRSSHELSPLMKFFFEKKRITRPLSASNLRGGRLTPAARQETTLPMPRF
jgi:hypothetical protein